MTALAAVTAALAAGAALINVPAAEGVAQGEDLVVSMPRYKPRVERLLGAGASGVLHRQEGTDGLLWTRWDGTSRAVPDVDVFGRSEYDFAGTDTVLGVRESRLRASNMDTGASEIFDQPVGEISLAFFGRHYLSRSGASGSYAYKLFTADVGQAPTLVADLTGVPAGATLLTAAAADAREAVVRYRDAASVYRFGLIDLRTGAFRGGPASGPTMRAVLTTSRLAWLDASTRDIHWVPRDNPTATPGTVDLTPYSGETPVIGAAGDELLLAWTTMSELSDGIDESGSRLTKISFTGAAPVEVLRHAAPYLVTAGDGNLVVVGGVNSSSWAIRRISGFSGGTAQLTTVLEVPPAAAKFERLSLANGVLATKDLDSGFEPMYSTRRVTTKGSALEVGPSKLNAFALWFGGEKGPFVSGDGRVLEFRARPSSEAYLGTIEGSDVDGFGYVDSTAGYVVDVTGRYAVVNGTDPTRQYVSDLDNGSLRPILSRSVTAASVWGTKLWTATTTNGKFTAIDVRSNAVTDTVQTNAPCAAKEIQVVGRWLHWACDLGAVTGVYDLTAKKNVTVPSGHAELGDGYLVRYNSTTNELLLTEFADGSASTRTIGTIATGERGVNWTVDKFGGPAAYIADDGLIHLVPSGVPAQPIGIIETQADTTAYAKSEAEWWDGRWTLSKPGAAWTLSMKNLTTNAVARQLSGNATGYGTVEARWDGRTSSGGSVPNGKYAWTLTVQPADGQGPAVVKSGSLTLSGGLPVRHDHVSSADIPGPTDGVGDMLTLNSKGQLTFHVGDGRGGFSPYGKQTGSGWSTSVKAVPFGDVNGDRCNDVLVRVGDALRVYKPGCGNALTPSTPYTSLGTGWSAYNVLTSPGDLTGDGRTDLLARKSSTSDVYLFAATSDGKLKAGVKIRTAWKSYTHIVGAGDLNGDGHGDVLARRSDGTLFRYDGIGNGLLKERVTLFTGWGASYTAIVGPGDITGDGKADVVVRDKNGVLYRNNGYGNGKLSARTQIATGWTYTGVF